MISLNDLCRSVSEKLAALPRTGLPDLISHVENFALLAKDPHASVEDFDDLLKDLYDFGDAKGLWIES